MALSVGLQDKALQRPGEYRPSERANTNGHEWPCRRRVNNRCVTHDDAAFQIMGNGPADRPSDLGDAMPVGGFVPDDR
jgi:hypothetical protein